MHKVTNRNYLYGLPHVMAHYGNKNVNSNKLDEDAVCVCCGKMATNAHHFPPKSTAPVRHRLGYTLRPALFAVCGSGTTGCHNGFHGGCSYDAWWEWYTEADEENWANGALLKKHGAHSEELYKYGRWVFVNLKTGEEWIYEG